MKRIGNLYPKIISLENLKAADIKARKGKGYQYGIKMHDKRREANIIDLHQVLAGKKYRTSEYTTFIVTDPKEREVFRLPYFPDRITHHAIMNILEPVFVANFTADTYSCIKNRGIHAASYALRNALMLPAGNQYCLKLDVRKFYPSVDHQVLKDLLARKIKDQDLLWLLSEIIDSAPGVPIGNYLSQYFANFYLSYFDHWIKEEKRVKHYFRYADDLVILSDDKNYLHQLLSDIRIYLKVNLKLDVKSNYQIFPVAARGVDFVGYVHYHSHTKLRKSIKKDFARAAARNPNSLSIPAYMGWAGKCESNHLIKTLLNDPNRKIIQGSRHPGDRIQSNGRTKNRDEQTVLQRNHRSPVPHRTIEDPGQRTY